jgi:uncharacterized membrane protein YhiD involved in acid resistance
MPDWLNELLHEALHENEALTPRLLAVHLAAALGCGLVVAAISRLSRRSSDGLSATLVLLAVLIALVTQVIGSSVARAFSLVGTLAIVRFRTVMEDTRDAAFLIAAVAVGMACGAGYLKVPLVALPFIAVAALLFRTSAAAGEGKAAAGDGMTLSLRLPLGRDPEALVRAAFDKYLGGARLTEAATARQGAALDVTYTVTLRPGASATGLVGELNLLEGVQAVSLRAR